MGLIRWGNAGSGSLTSSRVGGDTGGSGGTLQITTAALPQATVGTAYSKIILASGGVPPYFFDIEYAYPNTGRWLILPVSTLLGTTQMAEVSTVGIRVRDSANNSSIKLFNLTSVATGSLAIVTGASLPAATNGSFYAYQLLAKGGTPPYTWSWPAAQPWQVTVDGWIQGTPTATGGVGFSNVMVTDSIGATATFSPNLNVNTAGVLAGIDSTTTFLNVPPAIAGMPYGHQLLSYGVTNPIFSVIAGSFPPGISMSSSGYVSGTPTGSGNQSPVIKVTAGSGTQTIKFAAFNGVQSDNRDGDPSGNNRNLAEIQIIGTTGTGGSYAGSPIKAYMPYYTWGHVKPTTTTNNYAASVFADFNNSQQYCPGIYFSPAFLWANYASSYGLSSTPTIPSDILSNPSYGTGPVGSSGSYGWCLSGWTGSTWQVTAAAFWRTAVVNAWNAFLTEFANTSFMTTQGPYAGQTFTPNTHPLFMDIFDATENSWDIWNGPAVQADYSASAMNSAFESEMAAAVAAFTKTNFSTFQSYGVGPSFPDPTLPSVIAYAAANRNAMSNADCYGDGIADVSADEIYCGNVWNGSAWVPGGTDYRVAGSTQMTYRASVQPYDYNHQNGGAATLPQAMTNIRATASTLLATAIYWCIWDEVTGTPASFMSTYLLPFLIANPSAPSTVYPGNYP